MSSLRSLLALIMACGTVLLATKGSAWETKIEGSSGGRNIGFSVAFGPAGDVIAAGELHAVESSEDLVVVKLAGGDGTELWRTLIDGSAGGHDTASAVVVDSAGDAIVGGSLHSASTGGDFTVIKLSGVDGTELWRYGIDGGAALSDWLNALALDSAQNPIAVGSLQRSSTDMDLVAVKLSSATGTELWRVEIGGRVHSTDRAKAVVVDPGGDVIVAGGVASVGLDPDFFVVRLSGQDGTELWRASIAGDGDLRAYDEALSVAIDPAGDVTAAGYTVTDIVDRAEFNRTEDYKFAVVKFAGADGTELWRTQLDRTQLELYEFDCDRARVVKIDAGGDVIAAGQTNACDFEDFAVVKLSGADGTVLWRVETDGVAPRKGYLPRSRAGSLALDSAGNPVAAGELSGRTGEEFALMMLSGADGTEFWRTSRPGGAAQRVVVDADDNMTAAGVLGSGGERRFGVVGRSLLFMPFAGKRLRVVDSAGAASKKRLAFVSKDRTIETPTGGGPADPVRQGAELGLVNPSTGQKESFPLPASGWRALGNPPGSRGYRYNDPQRTNGPCNRVVLQPGRLTAFCGGEQIAFRLAEPTQEILTVTLKPGAGPVYCATFGGTVRQDYGTSTGRGERGMFRAADAPAPATCPLP